MNAISCAAASADLASAMEKVFDDHTPVIITGDRDHSAVLVSLADYEALEETAMLLRSPKNASRILSAIAQMDAGRGVEQEVDLEG